MINLLLSANFTSGRSAEGVTLPGPRDGGEKRPRDTGVRRGTASVGAREAATVGAVRGMLISVSIDGSHRVNKRKKKIMGAERVREGEIKKSRGKRRRKIGQE